MCEIYMMRKMGSKLNKTDLKCVLEMISDASSVNSDGWGMFSNIRKFRRDKFEDKWRVPAVTNLDKSDFVVGHARLATKGEVVKTNCHPFENERFVWVHNGVLTDADITGYEHTVDSEVIGNIILESVSSGKNIPDAVKDFAEKVSGSYSVFLYDKSTTRLYYFRNISKFTLGLVRQGSSHYLTGGTKWERVEENLWTKNLFGFAVSDAEIISAIEPAEEVVYEVTPKGITEVGEFKAKTRVYYNYQPKKSTWNDTYKKDEEVNNEFNAAVLEDSINRLGWFGSAEVRKTRKGVMADVEKKSEFCAFLDECVVNHISTKKEGVFIKDKDLRNLIESIGIIEEDKAFEGVSYKSDYEYEYPNNTRTV